MIQRHLNAGLTEQETLDRLKSFEPLYSKQLRIVLSWALLIASFIFCMYSGWLDYKALLHSEKVNDLFPRSGAILVAISVWSEYEPTRLNSAPINIPAYTVTNNYSRALKIFGATGVYLGIMGTVVWAYGDFLVEHLFDALN